MKRKETTLLKSSSHFFEDRKGCEWWENSELSRNVNDIYDANSDNMEALPRSPPRKIPATELTYIFRSPLRRAEISSNYDFFRSISMPKKELIGENLIELNLVSNRSRIINSMPDRNNRESAENCILTASAIMQFEKLQITHNNHNDYTTYNAKCKKTNKRENSEKMNTEYLDINDLQSITMILRDKYLENVLAPPELITVNDFNQGAYIDNGVIWNTNKCEELRFIKGTEIVPLLHSDKKCENPISIQSHTSMLCKKDYNETINFREKCDINRCPKVLYKTDATLQNFSYKFSDEFEHIANEKLIEIFERNLFSNTYPNSKQQILIKMLNKLRRPHLDINNENCVKRHKWVGDEIITDMIEKKTNEPLTLHKRTDFNEYNHKNKHKITSCSVNIEGKNNAQCEYNECEKKVSNYTDVYEEYNGINFTNRLAVSSKNQHKLKHIGNRQISKLVNFENYNNSELNFMDSPLQEVIEESTSTPDIFMGDIVEETITYSKIRENYIMTLNSIKRKALYIKSFGKRCLFTPEICEISKDNEYEQDSFEDLSQSSDITESLSISSIEGDEIDDTLSTCSDDSAEEEIIDTNGFVATAKNIKNEHKACQAKTMRRECKNLEIQLVKSYKRKNHYMSMKRLNNVEYNNEEDVYPLNKRRRSTGGSIQCVY